MKKLIISCLIIFILIFGCNRKTDNEERTDNIAEDIPLFLDDEIIVSQDNDLDQTVEIRIYQYFDIETNANEFIYQTVELSGNNFLENAINYLNANTGFMVKSISYEGTRLIVDFDRVMLNSLNNLGTAGGIQLSNGIFRTFSSFPNVTEMKFLFDGEEDLWGDHFSFEGIFRAGYYVRIGAGIEESDIMGLWEVEDDDRFILYFMPDNIYREGRKESSWDGIGKWELNGNTLILTLESAAYEKLENPIIEHINISIVYDKLILINSDGDIIRLVKSDYIQYLQ